MRLVFAALTAWSLAATAARADPVTPQTITGYAAGAAVQQGVPLDRRPAPEGAAPAAEGGFVAAGPDGAMYRAPEQAPATRRSMGLFGLSWTSN